MAMRRSFRHVPALLILSLLFFGSTAYSANLEGQRAFFTADDVLRAEPSAVADETGRAKAGERVIVGERRGFWRFVQRGQGASGWVRLSSLRLTGAAPAAGLAAIASARDATGNIVLSSGTRSVLGRNAPLTKDTLSTVRPVTNVLASLVVPPLDTTSLERFIAAGELRARSLSLANTVSSTRADANQEATLARELATTILSVARPLPTAALQHYVGSVGQWLASCQGGRNIEWRFAVIDSPSIVAFGLPGGLVFVSRGFFDLLDSEDELAAVLAREMAHVRRQHHLRNLRQPVIDTYLRPLDPSLDFVADEDGMRLAARAGYDAAALLTVLERLSAAKTAGLDVALLVATTPSTADRIAMLAGAVTPELEQAVGLSAAAERIKQQRMGSQ